MVLESVDSPPEQTILPPGPLAWFDTLRVELKNNSAFRRKRALKDVCDRVLSNDAVGGARGKGVQKAVLRSVSVLLTDAVLPVREAAQDTLVQMAYAHPQMRATCVKYAGQRLSTVEPMRVRLFLVRAIKSFALQALAVLHSNRDGGQGEDDAGRYVEGEDELWFEGARLAAIDTLQTYIGAEQVASQHTTYQHKLHGTLIEHTHSIDASPLEVLSGADGHVLWSRAHGNPSRFQGGNALSKIDRTLCQHGKVHAEYRELLDDAQICIYSEQGLILAQETTTFLQHLPQKRQELARLAHAACPTPAPALQGTDTQVAVARRLGVEAHAREREKQHQDQLRNVRILGYSGVFASCPLPPPSSPPPTTPLSPLKHMPRMRARGEEGEGEGEGEGGRRTAVGGGQEPFASSGAPEGAPRKRVAGERGGGAEQVVEGGCSAWVGVGRGVTGDKMLHGMGGAGGGDISDKLVEVLRDGGAATSAHARDGGAGICI